MSTRDQVMQVPFVGGVDQYTDPDQLQPPNMAQLNNCVIRKPGRIEKRAGMHLLAQTGTVNVPATTFGGAFSNLPSDIETIGTNDAQDGSKLLVAAGSTLFEYVGSDATHGYREVNRIPSCYGTLHPVDATGGEITEVESMVNDAGTLRCTAWVLGVRNGQDLTNDKAIREQPTGTHGLYVSVQRVTDGSFVTPPTRVIDAFGVATTQVSDMRMMLSLSDSLADTTRHWVIAFRRGYQVIEGLVVNGVDGSVKATRVFGGFPTTAFTGRPYWRAFDITSVPGRNYFVLAWCENDTSPASSDVNLRLESFNATTGVFATTFTMPGGVISNANASGSTLLSVYDWQRYTPRGVVLETDPISARIAVGIRMVYEQDAAPFYLDGKFVVTSARCSGGSISISTDDFAWLHRAGFQTEDSFASFKLGGPVGENKTTASCVQTNLILDTGSVSANTSVSAVLTALFADGSYQPYSVLYASEFSGAVFRRFGSPSPYMGQDVLKIAASGIFPIPQHIYPSDNNVDVQHPNWDLGAIATPTLDKAVIFQKNVTRVELGATPGPVGFANTVRYCQLSTASGIRCYAVVSFDAGGHPDAIALYNGMGANNVNKAPSLDEVVSLAVSANPNGPWGAPVAVPVKTIYVFDDFNKAVPLSNQNIVFEDVGSNTAPEPQTIVETSIGVEQCVHRWDVSNTLAGVVLAVSSTSAATFSGPNGDAPLGYVSPFARSNYFEVYQWVAGTQSRHDLNAYATTGSSPSTPIWCGIGGPWRMMSGLVRMDATTERLGCIVTPSGDDYQRSAFFISFTNGNATIQTELEPTDSLPIQYAGGVVYTDNKGVFVESMNMARVAAAPLNCPRLTCRRDGVTITGYSAGAIRQGQNDGGSEVFALDYTVQPGNWRTMRQWGDYTIVNGGVMSAYDGSSCNEVAMLLWPQSDLTSIAYDRIAFKLYQLDNPSTDFYGWKNPNFTFWYDYNYTSFGVGPLLWGITRPWFAYEAGLNSPNGNIPAGANGGVIGDGFCGWDTIKTTWGDDPTKDYQAVYIDPRFQQVQGRPSQAAGAGVNQTAMSHYYGRYQSGYSVYNVRRASTAGVYIVNWAPRNSTIDASTATANQFQQQNAYNPLVANGDFLVRWCYEAVDGTGRVVRSAPSHAVSFTVCATIQYSKGTAVSGQKPEPGGVVDEYRYGFYVPRLELTNRLKTAVADSKRTVLQPYFTAEPFATVFYRVPFSNFLTAYKNDFTISRNTTRGVVPYSSANAGGGNENPYGLVTNNFKCFDGPQGDYNGLLSQPFLYTTGGVLDNVPPPSALCMTVHQNRLVAGGADDATVVWFSKELSPTDAPGFNDALTIQIEDGGPVTGLASLESVLVIFKKNMTFIVPGDMPDDAGGAINRGYVSNTLGTPVRMPHGIGCIDHRSVVETPVGVFFQSARTIELLSRDMSIKPIGLKLDDSLKQFGPIVSAAHNAKDNEVWFVFKCEGFIGVRWATYNYLTDSWSLHNMQPGETSLIESPCAVTMVGTTPHLMAKCTTPLSLVTSAVFAQSDSTFFDIDADDTNNGKKYVSMSWQTAPIAMNNVQGFQRLKRIRVFGSPIPTQSTGATGRNPHGATFGTLTDYATSGPNNGLQNASWTEAEVDAVYADQGREVYEIHVAQQKGQSFRLAYAETPPTDVGGLTHGYGTAFSNMAVVVGLKAGLDKRITAGAKH